MDSPDSDNGNDHLELSALYDLRQYNEATERVQSNPEEVRQLAYGRATVLHRAVYANPPTEVLLPLIDAWPEALWFQNNDGLTPLAWLGDMMKESTADLLLAEVKKRCPPGSTLY